VKSGILSFGAERYRQKYLQYESRAVSAAVRFQFESHSKLKPFLQPLPHAFSQGVGLGGGLVVSVPWFCPKLQPMPS
jgi:hypothetical protein